MANNERNEQREPSSPLEWPSRDVRRQSQKTGTLNRIRVVLAEQEKTNRWLAEQMGVTDMTVSRWKTNKVQPSMAQFVEIAQLLKVDIKDLIEADFNYDIE